MKKILFITNIPAFYKVNLYNELSKSAEVSVIYLNSDRIKRDQDFLADSDQFSSYFLPKHGFINFLKLLFYHRNFDEIIVGGWDRFFYWIVLFFPKIRISLVLESSIYESDAHSFFKKNIKKIFLRFIDRVYASGQPHRELLDSLGFAKEIRITQGVGIINYPNLKSLRSYNKYPTKFLFVGRLEESKGIHILHEVFKQLADQFSLSIIGSGSLNTLISCSKQKNIKYLGYVENEKLSKFYQTHDMLIVPSIEEPWGLIVEEAAANHLPLLVSDRVGSRIDLIEKNDLGLVFKSNDKQELINTINNLQNGDMYEKLCQNVSQYNLLVKDRNQILQYLS